MTIARVKLIFSLFIFLRECEVIEGILPYGTHSLFSKDLLNFSREKTPPSRNSWSEVNRGVEASDPSASSTSENVMFDGTSWDGGQHFASYLEPSINFNPVDDKYHHTEMAIEASIQLPPYFSGNDLFEGTGWDGKQSFASLLEPDNLWSTPPSQNHGIGDPVSLEHSQTTAILSPEPNFVQPTTVKSLKSERPNILEVSHNSRLLRAVKTNASKKQNIPLNQKNSDKSFQVKNGEVKSITGVSQSGAHSLFSNDLLNFSGERIPPYEKSLREIGRRVDASDRKSSSKSENDLFEGTAGWDGLQPFFPFSESSANFIPLSDRYHHTLAEMGSLNQQITNFSKNDVFEGIGWDGEQSLTSMLEPEYSQNMVFSQNHHILSSNNLNYAVPLEQSREQPSFDQPLSDESFEVVRPIILESSRNNDSLRTIIKKSFKKRKTRVKNTKNQRFSSSWWNNIYLPDVINSLNEVEDIKLEFQIFLDIMDKLADDLISSKKDDYIRMNMNVDHDGLLKKINVAEESRSENFESNFGDIINQGDEPYHISLIKKFKEKISTHNSPKTFNQFLPLFKAMESQGRKNGFIYLGNDNVHTFFLTGNSRRRPADYLRKLILPVLDKDFYQVLNYRLVDICLEGFFNNDHKIMKERFLLTYIKYKIVPEELRVYRGILRSKLQLKNLYLAITTLINKIFCEGQDDLKQNFSKRQKGAIEFYDLFWKSVKLARPGEFSIDTRILPTLYSDKYLIDSELLMNGIVKSFEPDVLLKSDQTQLLSVWKFVDLWLIHYREDLYQKIKSIVGQQRTFRPFICSLLNFLMKLYPD